MTETQEIRQTKQFKRTNTEIIHNTINSKTDPKN